MFYRILFLTGILFFLAGQVLLAQGQGFVYSQSPIDFAHWFLFLGVTFIIPQVFNFPQNIFSYIGMPLTLIGIVCIVGMCVLDFLWWSYPTDEERQLFTEHVSSIPSIWKPFITVGPSSKVFNLGLFLLALSYFNKAKIGIGILLFANLILWNIIPFPYRAVSGYALTLIAFTYIFIRISKIKTTVETQ